MIRVNERAERGSPYPTRRDECRLLPRLEPVLHAGVSAPGPFSREELVRFATKGYVVVPRLFSAKEARHLLADVDTLSAQSESSVVREPESNAVRSLFGFHAGDGPLARLARDARLVERATQIVGSGVYVHQSRINRKSGFDGREFAWHSDFETWHAEDGMPRMRALSVSIALTRNDASNGPLMVIPGSHDTFVACIGRTPANHHESSLRRQEYGVPDRTSLTRLVDEHGIEVITAEPGTAVFFDCNLLHGSAGNITPRARTNAFIVYNSVDNALVEPFEALAPRPGHIAIRDTVRSLDPVRGPLA